MKRALLGVQRSLIKLPVCRVKVIRLAQPGIVLVEHVIRWTDFFPLWGAEYAIRVVAVFSDSVEILGKLPVLAQVLLCEGV